MHGVCKREIGPGFFPRMSKDSDCDKIFSKKRNAEAFVIIVTNSNCGDELQHIVARPSLVTETEGTEIQYNCPCEGCRSPDGRLNSRVLVMPNIAESMPFAWIFFNAEEVDSLVLELRERCTMHGREFKNGYSYGYGMRIRFDIKKITFGYSFDTEAWEKIC